MVVIFARLANSIPTVSTVAITAATTSITTIVAITTTTMADFYSTAIFCPYSYNILKLLLLYLSA